MGSLLIVLSLTLPIGIEKGESYELSFYCSKTSRKAHKKYLCLGKVFQ